MTWPISFGGLAGGNQPLSLFDTQFNQVAAMIDIPCSASGTNALSLTPLVNCPVLPAYVEFCAARFRAAGNSNGVVTAQLGGLGFLPVYHADGVTQASTGDLATGFEYVVRFSQALASGGGGWFLEAPSSFSSVNGALSSTPGGRLTFVSATPVMTSTQATPQTIYYAPYYHPFVPIFNGSTIQMYQFTANNADQVGLTLAMGGSASWPLASVFDVFVTLVSGVPTLCTVLWTNPATRATNLAVFGGFQTNATLATARTGAATTISLAANQGTFLGSFATVLSNGQSIWQYGASASGGVGGNFSLCNYYNKVQVNTIVIDSGAPYTYTSATVRSARASAANAIVYVQSDSERTASFAYLTKVQNLANSIAFTGIGVTNNSFNVYSTYEGYALNAVSSETTTYSLTATGFTSVFALEASDGVGANTFDTSNNQLFGTIWL